MQTQATRAGKTAATAAAVFKRCLVRCPLDYIGQITLIAMKKLRGYYVAAWLRHCAPDTFWLTSPQVRYAYIKRHVKHAITSGRHEGTMVVGVG
jgi:hypothetical protein